MKRVLLPIFALSLLLGACRTNPNMSARSDTSAHIVATSAAVSLGIKDSKWGPLPSYELASHSFTHGSDSKFKSSARAGALKLDLLLDGDGSVHDVAVSESSGDAVMDKSIASAFKNARALRLSPVDAGRHVLRFTMQIEIASRSQRFTDGASLGSLGPQPNYSPAPPANYSYSTSTP
jgi:hypothetical protein